MRFRLAPCLVLWAPIPKPSPQPRPPWIQLRMASCPDPKALPAAETSIRCGWLYPCCGNGLMGFRLAPCLVLWDFKTDGWPPVPIPKPSPQPRPPWIELRLALPMLRQWFDGILAGTLSCFMRFQKVTDGPLSRSPNPSPQPRPP